MDIIEDDLTMIKVLKQSFNQLVKWRIWLATFQVLRSLPLLIAIDFLSQTKTKYVSNLLSHACFIDYKLFGTPLDSNVKLQAMNGKPVYDAIFYK